MHQRRVTSKNRYRLTGKPKGVWTCDRVRPWGYDKTLASAGEIAAGPAVEVVFIVIGLAVLYRLWSWFFPVPKLLVVQAFQQGVVVVDGKVERVLPPGAYWVGPKRRMVLCDIRPTPFQVPSQDLLTADGAGVRISLAGEYRITNPGEFVTESSDAFATFYLELRQALRVATGESSTERSRQRASSIDRPN